MEHAKVKLETKVNKTAQMYNFESGKITLVYVWGWYGLIGQVGLDYGDSCIICWLEANTGAGREQSIHPLESG